MNTQPKLYRVTFDGTDDYVEAATFGQAIKVWREKLKADNNTGDASDFTDDQEPESVELFHGDGVLR